MTNNIWGAFIAGMAFTVLLVAIFQIGLNIGIKICISMLDGNYPAAMQYLNKHKKVGRVIPYVINGDN